MKLPTLTQAFLLHFAISLAVFCALVGVMVYSWFPGDLFFMDGGWEGLKIIAPIDLILGPALTLAFYRPWKKNVKFDMSVIVCLQVMALSYGVYAAHGQRTAAIVFAEDKFQTLSYNEFKAAQAVTLEKGRKTTTMSELGGKMPVLVIAEPFTTEEYGQHLADILNGDLELRERIDRYRPLASVTTEFDKFRTDETVADTAKDGEITEIAASSKGSEVISVPLISRYVDGELTLNAKTYVFTDIKMEK